MSTCKFFLQGTCKFGDNCKFSHQINDTSQTHGTSILRQNAPNAPKIDTNLLVKSVVTDMMNAEKGGHWLLSSYAPFKDKPCFPGFENRSFEEVRFGYYEAMKNRNVEQYKQHLQMTLQEAVMKVKALQNPTAEIIAMLIQIYNTPSEDLNSTAMPFGSIQSSSVYGQNPSVFNQNQSMPFSQNQSSSPLGFGQTQPSNQIAFSQSPPQETSIFALANQELFGKNMPNQQQSIFGTNTNIFNTASPQNTSPTQNMFGANQSIFSNQQNYNSTGNSIFAKPSFPPTTQSNPFAAQNNIFPMKNNIFAPGNNGFVASNAFNLQPQPPFQNPPPNNSPFNNQVPPVNNSVFLPTNPQAFSFAKAAANITQSPFAQQPQQQSIFASSVPQQNTSPFQQPTSNNTLGKSIFNTQTATPNIFTAQPPIFNSQTTNVEQKPSNPIFSQTLTQSNSVLGGNTEVIDSSAYSKLEDLSENEIKSFESACFEFGKIPEKPPTAQMCT